MREQLRQKMREMVATLGKGEALLDSRVKKKNTDMLEQLLEDMQNSAIAIGKIIEQEEGYGTKTVAMLEEYCELLYEYLTEQEPRARFKIGRTLAGKRGEISKYLETEFEGTLVAVFLVGSREGWHLMEPFWDSFRDKGQRRLFRVSDTCPDVFGGVKAEAFELYRMAGERPDFVFLDGPGGKAACEFGPVRENTEIVIYLPHWEGGAEPKKEDCISPASLQSDILVVPSKRAGYLYSQYISPLENGNELARRIYVAGAADSARLMKKCKNFS